MRFSRFALVLGLVQAWFFAATAAWGQAPRAPRLRTLVLESRRAAETGGEETAPRPLANVLEGYGVFDVRSRKRLVGADLGWAEIVILERDVSDGGEEIVADLDGFAIRGGVVIATVDALRSLEESKGYSDLLGRRELGKPSTSQLALAVAVHDQSHDITQCVTHFLHRGVDRTVELSREAEVLASSLPIPAKERRAADAGRPRPALWLLRRGAGRVVATSLDHRQGPSRDLVSTLLARAAQWGAGRPVSLPLKGTFRLACEDLGSGDTGLFPGRPAAKGF